jgi:predicted secreted Zn-dependent protease
MGRDRLSIPGSRQAGLAALAVICACKDLRPGMVELTPHVYVVTEEHRVAVAGDTFEEARIAAVGMIWNRTASHARPTHTVVTFTWRYWMRDAAKCFVTEAAVEMYITHYFPRWTPPASAKPADVTAWQTWLALREKLARRKAELALERARALVTTIESTEPRDSCKALEQLTSERAARASQLVNEAIDNFDESDEVQPEPDLPPPSDE